MLLPYTTQHSTKLQLYIIFMRTVGYGDFSVKKYVYGEVIYDNTKG